MQHHKISNMRKDDHSSNPAEIQQHDADVKIGRPSSRHFKRHQEKAAIELPLGLTFRGRYQIKAALQTVIFVTLVAGYGVVHLYKDKDGLMEYDPIHRLLQESTTNTLMAPTPVPCSAIEKAEPVWLATFYSIGILYMFMALAIVCDEFFVPALEEMSSPRRFNLSMDVAGNKHGKRML
jgi:hypothetical protein